MGPVEECSHDLVTGDRVYLAMAASSMLGSSAEHVLADRCVLLWRDLLEPSRTADRALEPWDGAVS